MWNPFLWLLGCAVGSLAHGIASTAAPASLGLHLSAGSTGAVLGGVVFLIFDTTPLHAIAIGALVPAGGGALVAVLLVRRVLRHLWKE